MSYNLSLNAILVCLRRSPCALLADLSLELRVSRRTIENTVRAATGKTFRSLRDEILVERIRGILVSHPAMSIKEVSFAVGFKSPSSFSRTIKRICGTCPEDLRSRVTR